MTGHGDNDGDGDDDGDVDWSNGWISHCFHRGIIATVVDHWIDIPQELDNDSRISSQSVEAGISCRSSSRSRSSSGTRRTSSSGGSSRSKSGTSRNSRGGKIVLLAYKYSPLSHPQTSIFLCCIMCISSFSCYTNLALRLHT